MEEKAYYNAINDKLITKNFELSIKDKNDLNEKNITSELVTHYDFSYDKEKKFEQILDKNIMTKDRLVQINHDFSEYKNLIIMLLKYFLYLLLFFFFLALGYVFNLYGTTVIITIVVITLITYIIYVYVKIYDLNIFNIFQTKETGPTERSFLQNAAKFLLPNFITRDRCPKNCRPKYPDQNIPLPNLKDLKIKEMRTDSTITTDWNKDDKKYNCKWDGVTQNFDENGLYKMNEMPAEFTSRIPCDYFPGYKEK